MKKLQFFLLALTLVSAQAIAREGVPVMNLTDIAVPTASGKSPDLAQVKKAIEYGAGIRQWTLSEQGPGLMVATLNVRGKHTVVVEIKYAADKYSLTYRDSNGMNAAMKNGQQVIHPNYNRWVKDLSESIRVALPKA